MICPLMSRPLLLGMMGQAEARVACEREDCAWWKPERELCAVRAVSSFLDSLLYGGNLKAIPIEKVD